MRRALRAASPGGEARDRESLLLCAHVKDWEPYRRARVVGAGEIELLLVPLEGISASGVRLGKGGGYYDRLLAACPALTLGAALSWQWTEDIPRDPWDRPLNACACAEGIRIFRQ